MTKYPHTKKVTHVLFLFLLLRRRSFQTKKNKQEMLSDDKPTVATLHVSNDPYAHQDEAFRKVFESRDIEVYHPFDTIQKATEADWDWDWNDNVKESELNFVNDFFDGSSTSIPADETMNHKTPTEMCVFYDHDGARLDAKNLTTYQLNARFEFVVAPNGSVISKTCTDVALIERQDQDGNQKCELARIASVYVDSATDVRMSYRLFNDDTTFNTISCEASQRTAYLGKYHCGIYHCPSHPMLQHYKKVCRKLTIKTKQQRLDKIGVWSRARGFKAAFVSAHVMDVADFLEFYHIRAKWMWRSRLGMYACETYIQPILNKFGQSQTALQILSIARNARFLDIQPQITLPNNNVCMLCGDRGVCTVILDGHVFVATDMKCSIALYVMCLVPNALMRFRNTTLPDQRHFETLKSVFAHARVHMQTLHDS